jgi:hypothetical protein
MHKRSVLRADGFCGSTYVLHNASTIATAGMLPNECAAGHTRLLRDALTSSPAKVLCHTTGAQGRWNPQHA